MAGWLALAGWLDGWLAVLVVLLRWFCNDLHIFSYDSAAYLLSSIVIYTYFHVALRCIYVTLY